MSAAAAEERAREATVQTLFNCYLRETDNFQIETRQLEGERRTVVHCSFDVQRLDVFVPLAYRSPVGRHRFAGTGWYRPFGGELRSLDYTRLASILLEHLAERYGDTTDRGAILRRILQSHQNIEHYVAERGARLDGLFAGEFTFGEAEQSLLFGHQMHPTPKSRAGIASYDARTYAPELNGSFPLHYVLASPDIVASDSALEMSAAEGVDALLRDDSAVTDEHVRDAIESEDVLIPIHPWQASYLRTLPRVQRLFDDGRLVDLGPLGREFVPTTSVRTLYHPETRFMVKCSLNVTITNSVRTNKRSELRRGIAVVDLFESKLGSELFNTYPQFEVIHDPAYLTVKADQRDESGFEVLLRENPFVGTGGTNVTPVVALCQDCVAEGGSRIGPLISSIASEERRSTDAVATEWFRRYLDVAVEPVVWLYLVHGIAVEAHQQNAIVALDEGYPVRYFQRDNQGYYVPRSKAAHVEQYVTDLHQRIGTVYPDETADERLRYQLFVNNVFGLINALGVAGVVTEETLLEILEERLVALREYETWDTALVSALLDRAAVPRKANLRTRFRDLDEQTSDLDEQSVYTPVPNPIRPESRQ